MRSSRGPLVAFLAVASIHLVAHVAGAADALDLLRHALGIGAAVVAVVTARRRTVRRGGWWLIAAGLVAAASTDLAWGAVVLGTGTQPSTPWIGDLGSLLGWATVVAGVTVVIADPVPARRMTARLDVGVLCLTAAAVLWFVVAEDLILGTDLSPGAAAIVAVHLLTDLALLGMVATLLLDPQPRTVTVRLLTVALAVQLVGDLVHLGSMLGGGYVVGGPATASWTLALVLMVLALVHPSSAVPVTIGGPPEALSRRRLWVLWSAIGVTASLAALAGVDRTDQRALAGALVGGVATVLMASLVLWRLWLATDSLRTTLREREHLQAQVEHEASHDALTGLANRRALTVAAERGDSAAVVLLDLHRLKEINDRFGHAAGDEVLCTVAERLVDVVGRHDLVARVGGDEFGVLITAATSWDALTADLLATVRGPMTLSSGSEIRVDASLGLAPRRPVRDASAMFEEAEAAMYEAKQAGRGHAVVYSEGLHEELTRRGELTADLDDVLARGELDLVYQPLLRFGDRRTVGVEALLRWHHPRLGRINPADFISLAEGSGHIRAIGRWVLAEASRTVAALRREFGDLELNVNVSAVQLHHRGFAAMVQDVLAETGLDAAALTLEITESVLLEDAPTVRSTVASLRQLGVRFAVDDFGTGYSALRYLRDVPLDELKIDRSFVADVDDRPAALRFVRAMVDLASRFELRVVAEGIETDRQLAALAASGCDLAQGYLFSRPLPVEGLSAWLEAERARPHASPRVGPT